MQRTGKEQTERKTEFTEQKLAETSRHENIHYKKLCSSMETAQCYLIYWYL